MQDSAGFIVEQSEAERLFAMAAEENFVLRQSLDKSQHELLATQQKLAKAKEQLVQFGYDVSELNIEVEDTREGLMETFEATLNNEAELEDCRTAIIELYEMIGE